MARDPKKANWPRACCMRLGLRSQTGILLQKGPLQRTTVHVWRQHCDPLALPDGEFLAFLSHFDRLESVTRATAIQ